MAPVYLPQFVRCGLWPENEIWLLRDKETQQSYPNVDWTGKRGVFMAAILRILGAKKFHGGGVYMSFSFDWTAISRNKSQVNWGKSKVKSFATKSCSKLVQSFNRLNDFRTSTLMCCRTSYRYFCLRSSFRSSSYHLPSVFVQRQHFLLPSSRTFFCCKPLFSNIISSFSSFVFSATLFLS